ncbi:hypothetical protein RM698_11875 [Streptomyces sp. DSM 41979]|uniref:Aminotransferase class I/classII large domain-containing protein n=1 Tax=Streptomyces evansiae TaxID=3075535 RepID=A0ABU2QZ62_9ACTN|nr:aminotransferase class I/II-fold pyridoxal phosphate-dependent enzyme [Streptomyces sp. DSM 41979]MDT0409742.1 hypothetical protein [Streptomyces sp. DSM 41979]
MGSRGGRDPGFLEPSYAVAGFAAPAELSGRLGETAGDGDVVAAACGYWARRGLETGPERVLLAPGGGALLLALLAARGGDILVPRPCAAWWLPQARLLGRAAHPVPTPAEYGGVPDPYALMETVRRVLREGGDPRVLVLGVVDDPTGTVPEPEAVDAALEAAAGCGLTVVVDESLRDTPHSPHHPLVLSPARAHPDDVVVLTDLAGALLPADWPLALARFPATPAGLALRARTADALTVAGARPAGPLRAPAAHALAEPPELRARARAIARAHGLVARAAHARATAAGAFALPPRAGRSLLVDLGPVREALAARGVLDAVDLEADLGARLPFPVHGGHRFGDPLPALRVRVPTAGLLGPSPAAREPALTSPDPLALPDPRRALSMFEAVLRDLAATEPPHAPGTGHRQDGTGTATHAGRDSRGTGTGTDAGTGTGTGTGGRTVEGAE